MDVILYFKTIDNEPAKRKLAGANKAAVEFGWNLQVISPDCPDVRALLDFWHPAGCIVNSASGWNNFNGELFGDVPVVFIDRPTGQLRKTDSLIIHDSAETVRCALRELLSLKPKICAYVRWPTPVPWDDARVAEFKRIMTINGLPSDVMSPVSDLADDLHLVRELVNWIKRLPKPAAILGAADPLSAKILAAARRAGCSVPDEVAVLGIDNETTVCEQISPGLSSIEPDHRHAGYRAAEMLRELMKCRKSRRRAVFRETYGAPRLVRRGSTFPAKVHDHQVLQACDLIRHRACEGLAAADVLEMFSCSRRNAEYRFRAATGMSILESIQTVRLERARELLAAGHPAAYVASACGYASASALLRFLRQFTASHPIDR